MNTIVLRADQDSATLEIDGRVTTMTMRDLRKAASQDMPPVGSEYSVDATTMALAESYRRILAQVDQYRADASQLRVAECSGHSAMKIDSLRCFAGPVSRDENPMAHGGTTETEYCRCGAVRDVNRNGCHAEIGPWRAGDATP